MKFTTPTPTTIRIQREFDAPVELVWRTFTEPNLVKRWMTGPPDHSLPVCTIDLRVGGKARYVWKNPQFEMGMAAQFQEVVTHERIVHTEAYDGWSEGNSTVVTSFSEKEGRTTVTVMIEYLNQAARDAAMEPGFEAGYAASFTTLAGILAQEIQS